MKLNKLFAGIAASAVAVSALTATASAQLVFPSAEEAHAGASTAGNWLVQVYNIGNEAEGKPATDYGLDVTAIARIDVTFEVCEGESRDWFEGGCGGSVITSCNGSQFTDEEWNTYNWPSNEWWGVIDDDLGLATQAPEKECLTEKVGDYTYKVSKTLSAEERFLAKSDCVQIGLQEWGDTMNDYKVIECACYDDAGNLMISFDFYGNPTLGGGAAEAPAEDAPAADTSAPAAGDVAGATDSSKGSPDTGVEDVAVVAGLAIVAAGAVLVSKKRK